MHPTSQLASQPSTHWSIPLSIYRCNFWGKTKSSSMHKATVDTRIHLLLFLLLAGRNWLDDKMLFYHLPAAGSTEPDFLIATVSEYLRGLSAPAVNLAIITDTYEFWKVLENWRIVIVLLLAILHVTVFFFFFKDNLIQASISKIDPKWPKHKTQISISKIIPSYFCTHTNLYTGHFQNG